MSRTITPTEVAAAIVVARARLYVEAMQDATAVEADHPDYERLRDATVRTFLALQDATETYDLATNQSIEAGLKELRRRRAAEGAQG
jgi:hypothetical protein